MLMSCPAEGNLSIESVNLHKAGENSKAVICAEVTRMQLRGWSDVGFILAQLLSESQ